MDRKVKSFISSEYDDAVYIIQLGSRENWSSTVVNQHDDRKLKTWVDPQTNFFTFIQYIFHKVFVLSSIVTKTNLQNYVDISWMSLLKKGYIFNLAFCRFDSTCSHCKIQCELRQRHLQCELKNRWFYRDRICFLL